MSNISPVEINPQPQRVEISKKPVDIKPVNPQVVVPVSESLDEARGSLEKLAHDQSRASDIPDNIVIGKSSKGVVEQLLHFDEDFSHLPVPEYEKKHFALHQVDDEEIKVLRKVAEKARSFAVSLGISDADLIEPRQIRVIDVVDVDYDNQQDVQSSIGGGVDPYYNGIEIEKPEKITIEDPNINSVIYHEYYHWASRRVLAQDPYDSKGIYLANSGFDKYFLPKGISVPKSGIVEGKSFGFWDESLATLFQRYCSDSNVIYTAYFNEVSFMQAFLEDFAQKKNIDVVDAFKEVATRNATGDFSFFKDLQNLYDDDLDFVRSISNISKTWAFSDEQNLTEVAEKGGFSDRFKELNSQQEIAVKDTKGIIMRKKLS